MVLTTWRSRASAGWVSGGWLPPGAMKCAGLLVATKRDRFARDVILAAQLERLVERDGAELVSADGASEGNSPEATMMRRILDIFGAFERDLIRARTRRRPRPQAAQGESAATSCARPSPSGAVTALPDGRVRVSFKAPWRSGTAHADMDAHQFLARLCALVAPPGFHVTCVRWAAAVRSETGVAAVANPGAHVRARAPRPALTAAKRRRRPRRGWRDRRRRRTRRPGARSSGRARGGCR